MKITSTRIPDVKILEPRVFEDERGFFYESYNQKAFDDAIGYPVTFVQDNHSRSIKGTLRGLHYQLPPHSQGKLVRVTVGEIFDVAVDIRKSSSTLGQWVGETLSVENRRQMWIPPGFAHGFLVISETAEFQYKCTGYYAPDLERCIHWNDENLDISWPLYLSPLVSSKDEKGVSIQQADLFQ